MKTKKIKLTVLISVGVVLIAAAVLTMLFLTRHISPNSKTNDSEESVLDVIKTTYSNDDPCTINLPITRNGVYFKGGAYDPSLYNFLESFSVELSGSTRKFNFDNREYSEKYYILRFNNEVIGDYYVYAFFRSIPYDEDGDWIRVGRAIRVAKRLTAKDFENITNGSTIADVTAVDPVTSLMVSDHYGILNFETFHYTVDGLVYITFERETANEELLVSKVDFDSSFNVPINDRGRDRNTDYKYVNGNDPNNPEPPVYQKIELKHLPD